MADEPFVDAHIHFWDKSATGLEWAWLEPGYQFRKWTSHPSIDAPRYSTPEFLDEASATGLAGAVHVHATDPIRPVAETVWLQSVADATGWPHAIVGACDLEADDAVETIRDQAACERFRGVREPMSPQRLDADAAAPALDALAGLGSTLEVRRHHAQFDAIDAIAARWPELTILLSHACLPLERTADELAAWSQAMRSLAARRANVVCKISTVVGASQPDSSLAAVRPWVMGCVDAFGPSRCMVGSNFPIDRPFCTFTQLIDVYRQSISELAPHERADVMAGTATRVYHLSIERP
jgi:predicted TIM-barrel fold metal-dependent hydrolase